MPVEFKIILPAKLEYFQAFQSSISNYARQQGISPARISEIELAVEEALVNVFHYAYKETNGEVEVVCQVNSKERLIIEITDFGIPFNPLLQEAPQVTDDISERKVGGLGVYFIKTVMDEVYYRREGDKNILTLVVYKK